MSLVFDLLRTDGYVVVNKKLMRVLGIDSALLLGELISEYSYYQDREELTDDGFFFSKSENIERNINLSAYRQREAFKVLELYGLVEKDFRGVPAKNYYRLDTSNIEEFLLSDFKNFESKPSTTASPKIIEEPAVKNFEGSLYKNNNREISNKDLSKEKSRKKEKSNPKKKKTALEALEGFKEEFNLSEELTETLKDFIEMRKEIKDPITVNGLKRAINTLFKLSADPGEQLEIINQSIIAGYKGLFPLKYNNNQRQQYKPTTAPIEEELDGVEKVRRRLLKEEEERRRKEEFFKMTAEEEKEISGLLTEGEE